MNKLLIGFNSLQTGNCIQTNVNWLRCNTKYGRSDRVSIPFKRETAFKPACQLTWLQRIQSFNSLQTGNCIQTQQKTAKDNDDGRKFQFPSNGKLHSNFIIIILWYLEPKVSIPFKRETAFKLHTELTQRKSVRFKFQFPSNGKLHSNLPRYLFFHLNFPPSFNSLQTGNCIQTAYTEISRSYEDASFQFPSNGKLHSNFTQIFVLSPLRGGAKFQFPSNGKLHSNRF